MTDVQNPVGSAPVAEGSAPVNSPDSGQTPDKQTQEPTPKVVSWEVHQQFKDDFFKLKENNRQLEAKLGDIESQRLKEKEDWKTLYEKSKQESEAKEEKLTKLSSYLERTKQFDEVRASALQAGLRSEAVGDLELLNFDDVKVEVTNTGRYHVHGVSQFVEKLKNTKPHWFTDSVAPNVNGGRGGATPPTVKAISAEDIVLAEKQMKRGVITRSAFEEKYKQYVAQDSAKT